MKSYPFLSLLSAGAVGFSASYVDSQGTVHYGIVTNVHVAEALDIMKLSISETVGSTILSTVTSTTDVAFKSHKLPVVVVKGCIPVRSGKCKAVFKDCSSGSKFHL